MKHSFPNMILQKFILPFFVIVILLASLSMNSYSQPNTISQANKIKASYLLRLASYVRSDNTESSEFEICIIGNNVFGNFLNAMIQAKPKNKNNMPIRVYHYPLGDDFEDCKIAFVSAQDTNNEFWKSIPEDNSILLVGDHPDFIKNGGIAKFYLEKKRIRIEINLAAAKDANLEISSELLRVVKITKNISRISTK